MNNDTLMAISPIDGRYHRKVAALTEIVSEYGLMKYRLTIEARWLLHLVHHTPTIKLTHIEQTSILNDIVDQFSINDAEKIKTIEQTTRHDVKAVEYFLRDTLSQYHTLAPLLPFIHFACTSEDINNLAYGLMFTDARTVALSELNTLQMQLDTMAQSHCDASMLSRTHGQAASPTTMGKEIRNTYHRLSHQLQHLSSLPIFGKFNGAVGNYNAHAAAFPTIDWPQVCQHFVESLGLSFNHHTTQIEPHDNLAECLHTLTRINTILIDFARDIWHYISLNYFTQHKAPGQVGSSTMPHKINPIDFENAEGNLGIANALATHLATKLPISRLQRDLSDSTVLRNLGVIFAHSVLAYQSLQAGLNKLSLNQAALQQDLAAHWEVIAEPIQTVLRAHGFHDAYEQLKSFSQGKAIDQQQIQEFIAGLSIPDSEKQRLAALTPDNYTGLAASLAQQDTYDDSHDATR